MKELIERRGAVKRRMAELIGAIKDEKRAFSTEEQAEFEKLEGELGSLNATIEAEKRAQAAGLSANDDEGGESGPKFESYEQQQL